jgi:pimeloyl-ACP methyl ester carboxylesterase
MPCWLAALPAMIVAPTCSGIGECAKPRGEYSFGAHANLLRDVLNVRGHDRATFVGQSLVGGVVVQMAYQFPERCERLVLVDSGGLGREVNLILHGLAVPLTEQLLRLVCNGGWRAIGDRVGGWLRQMGVRIAPAAEDIWRSYASLADADTRWAFFRTLRAVVDPGRQSVSAANRLYLAANIPTLIVWGARDPFIRWNTPWPLTRSFPAAVS